MSAIPEGIEYHLPIDLSLVMSWLAVSIIVLISWLGTRRLAKVPAGLQNLLEWVLGIITDFADDLVGPTAPRYYPLFAMLFFFILVSNLMGLVPGLVSSTSRLSTTAGLALIVFVATHYFGIRERGLWNYIKRWFGPVPTWLKPFMFFIEIMGELARPLSLAFRLFGNILAKEILLGVLALLVVIFLPSGNVIQEALSVVPIILRPLIILLGLLVSVIQAFVFMILAMVYIGGAVQAHSGH
ncbi:MAG: F0F1 ATP synthase subunit A [Candidatus Firestonebacteria bacterium]|nr:F0F1 ATP synthase subunit A [Candidatus Firestonebacteria bacterium]